MTRRVNSTTAGRRTDRLPHAHRHRTLRELQEAIVDASVA